MDALDDAYLVVLNSLPGLVGYKLLRPRGAKDSKLKLRTKAGGRELVVRLHRSHLSHSTADHVAAVAQDSDEPVLVVAPHIGATLGERFADAGINYLDANGNCHIDAPPIFIHIEGKRGAPVTATSKGIRSAGYQVLFTYLAQPGLLDATIRSVADLAGVSRQPVSDMKRRLVDDEYVLETKAAVRWNPRRLPDALSLWLHGYETAVRPSLLLGAYRTREADPELLEATLARVLAKHKPGFRWGGSAAGFRMTGHYRGTRTVVHVPKPPSDLPKLVRALPDPRGNLVVLDTFGSINWAPGQETVHPLLVYSEILNDSDERAREAAQMIYNEYLVPTWEEK